MFRKGLYSLVFAGMLAVTPLAAQVYVTIAPPKPLVERRIPAPGPGYVWVPGYHRWEGGAYAWTAGRWVMPPRPHARWVAGHWTHRSRGWVWVEGRWR